jgi:demethylmenaquinone methyltransferase/2-methoxy-6-polyprenyl-1,4-benzoquinol methylase
MSGEHVTGGPAQVPTRDRWDLLSVGYDRQLWLERAAVRTAVALMSPVPHECVLDVGTGTGEVLRALARHRHRPRAVLGIDRSRGMLARVGGLPDGWSLALADARSLPAPDDAYDAVCASYVLHLLDASELEAVLSEIRRVLRPGGRLVTVTPAIPDRGLSRPLASGLDWLARRWPKRFDGLRALDPTTVLTGAGFTVITTRLSLRGYPSIVVLSRRAT